MIPQPLAVTNIKASSPLYQDPGVAAAVAAAVIDVIAPIPSVVFQANVIVLGLVTIHFAVASSVASSCY